MYFYLSKSETMFHTASIQTVGLFRDTDLVMSVIATTDYLQKAIESERDQRRRRREIWQYNGWQTCVFR
jgi:hypothetical protein